MAENKAKFRISEEKRKILLVEDEIINQEILKESIGDAYELIIANTGEEALETLREKFKTLSMILLDLNLPGINGIDILRTVKSNPVYDGLPVIVMTSDGEAEVECLTLGAVDFIPKPYPPSKVVLARIRRTVELYEDRDTLRWTERDRLTGLYNRDFFYHYAYQLDTYHKDTLTDAIALDINNFHTFNERYGKAYGDRVLKRIAEKILRLISETGGLSCRCGPDMFYIYCPHRTDYEEILEKLSVDLEGGDSAESHVRLRMGVYSDADKTVNIERRFDRAKMAANSVKGNLAKPIGFYDKALHDAEMLEEQLVDGFSAAIKEKQFTVFYQPKFAIQHSEPVLSSAEALARWNHPKLGMVSPGVFIPLFEKNGLIQALDNYIWAETAAQIRDWKDRLRVSVPVSVNVSRIDLYDPELTDKLLNITGGNGLGPEELILEITESAYTENSEIIIEKVKQLRGLGFKIEMDDFGSGYSSLSMLSSLPIDVLKLDMQFIRSAFGGNRDTRLLEMMIDISHSLDIPTVAEGVEDNEQLSALKKMSCDVIQGYCFSRPLPANEFERFIAKK